MNPLLSHIGPPTRLLSSEVGGERLSSSESEASEDVDSFSYEARDGDVNLDYNGYPSKSLSRMGTSTSTYRSVAVISDHSGSVSCLALCGEFILSATQGKDIIVWQQPDLRLFTKFGHGDGSVKAVVTFGINVFTAHQDSRIRVWKLSKSSENVFKLVNTLPTAKDYLKKFILHRSYIKTGRHNKKQLWFEHADSISCLTVHSGLIYSGSWDKTFKVWRLSDLKCLESIKAHDEAINALAASKGIVYSASADGKIKAWRKEGKCFHALKGILEGHNDASVNSVITSEDGRWVYGGGSDGYIMGWEGNADLMLWKLVSETNAHNHMAVLCMCMKGEILCSGSADKSIGIWKREACGNLSKIWVIEGHQGPVKCLQAAPNNIGGGFLLYSGSNDKSIRLWWIPLSSSNRDSIRETPTITMGY
ncbi:Transducin/WD40 repeat-like superfamily protein [Euphorbia peplus]|nr:Transducin/WD40 repeat-like superfamily protein [Euphorbia peplus]